MKKMGQTNQSYRNLSVSSFCHFPEVNSILMGIFMSLEESGVLLIQTHNTYASGGHEFQPSGYWQHT
jgi:hypothetical protein